MSVCIFYLEECVWEENVYHNENSGNGYGDSVAMHTVGCNPLYVYVSCLVTFSMPLSYLIMVFFGSL